MNLFVKTAVVAAVLGASAAASADTFDFSYTFADTQEVTGSFTGTLTDGGQAATSISNIQLSLNGIAFAPVGNTGGALQANTWNPTLVNFDSTTPVTIYSNGALNNFIISDVNAAVNTSPDYEFVYINDSANGLYEATAANFLQSDSFSGPGATQLAIDFPGVAASWKLSDVGASPVPVPAALPLLASGLGMLRFARRRRAA